MRAAPGPGILLTLTWPKNDGEASPRPAAVTRKLTSAHGRAAFGLGLRAVCGRRRRHRSWVVPRGPIAPRPRS